MAPTSSGLSQALARWLTGQEGPPTDQQIIGQLARLRVAGALARRWAGTPAGDALRPQLLRLAFRHLRTRALLTPLLEAWSEAGLQVILLKGFYLAEYEYVAPGERSYGDVDILIGQPGDLWPAIHLALALGWRSDGLHAQPDRWNHEVAHFVSPTGEVRLDLHRYPYRVGFWPASKRAALTADFCARSRPVPAGGALCLSGLRLPDPRDAALGVALTRAWGVASENLRPSDYLDLATLIPKYHLSPQEITEHAKHCGARATWQTFLQHCNPWTHTFNWEGVAAALDRAAYQDSATRGRRLWNWRRKVKQGALLFSQFPSTLPDLAAAYLAVRAGGDPRQHLQRWNRPSQRISSLQERDRIIRAVYWSTRILALFSRRRQGICVPRAYATYRALWRRGHPVRFVSGVHLSPTGLVSHAWVEDLVGPLSAYAEPTNRRDFKVLLEYPAREPR